jgi:DNA topoisomerase IB
MAVELYPHQQRAVAKLASSGGLLCIHSTGSGKTLLSAAAIKALLVRRSRSRPSLDAGKSAEAFVIARKSAVGQFAAEVARFAPELAPLTFVGTHQAVMSKLSARPAGDGRSWPRVLVVDEAHEYVNPKGKRFAEVQAACRRAAFVLLLTATPIVNSPRDLVVLTSLARREPVGGAGGAGGAGASGRGAALAAAADALLDPAGSRFARWFGRFVDVHLVDKSKDPRFPAVFRHTVRVPMSAATRAEYERRLARPSPFFMNLRQLSLGAGRVSEKGRWLVENAKRWVAAGEGKIVVYSAFLDRGARKMRDLLTSAGLNVLVIDGKSSAKDRRRAALMFNRRTEEEPREELHRDLRALVLSRARSRSQVSGERPEHLRLSRRALGPAAACPGGMLVRRTSHRSGPSAEFSYRYDDAAGVPAGEAERLYAQDMVIPPPWSPAYVCVPNEKLLWVARDQTGKWQYRYSADWGDQQEYRKFLRLREMAGDFPRDFARRVADDIRAGRASGAGASAVLRAQAAVAALLLSRCFFRVGAEGTTSRAKGKQKSASKAARSEGVSASSGATSTFGVTSLRVRHVQEASGAGGSGGGGGGARSLRICFRGKSGQTNRCLVTDPLLVSGLLWLKRLRRVRQGSDEEQQQQQARLFDAKVTASAVRRYLGEIRAGLRPKDFRTYAANLALLRHLLAGPDPTKMKPGQRARRLAEGYRAASALLNNTPRMAKDAYVFSGLWVLYQVDPTRFLSAVQGAKLPEAALDRLVRLFDENRIDWRYMLRWFKESGGVASFMGPAQVLMITDAGSESIDLAGTRHIVFLDATWTPALEDQIVGRGQRFGSHAHLPQASRRLDVWKLFLTRGKGQQAKGAPAARPESSVDAYVDALNQEKRRSQEALYRRLAAL